MRKFTIVFNAVLFVICLTFIHAHAETYHKVSKQYEMCILDNNMSIGEKIECADNEYRRIVTCIVNDVNQFNKIPSIPKNIKEKMTNYVNNWFEYDQSRIKLELVTAQDVGGMHQVMGVFNDQIQRALQTCDWITDKIEEIGYKYTESVYDAE